MAETQVPVGQSSLPTTSQPTHDQLYLAGRLNGDALMVEPRPHRITPAAVQRWNRLHGTERVTSALRLAHGFGPPEGIANPYAYVAGILAGAPYA